MKVRPALVILVISLILVVVGVAQAQPSQDKVSLCHGTSSVTNPYVKISVSDTLEGHDQHTGPIATDSLTATELKKDHTQWGDIIPPVGEFTGLNWTTQGQTIFNNNCNTAEDDTKCEATVDNPDSDGDDRPCDTKTGPCAFDTSENDTNAASDADDTCPTDPTPPVTPPTPPETPPVTAPVTTVTTVTGDTPVTPIVAPIVPGFQGK